MSLRIRSSTVSGPELRGNGGRFCCCWRKNGGACQRCAPTFVFAEMVGRGQKKNFYRLPTPKQSRLSECGDKSAPAADAGPGAGKSRRHLDSLFSTNELGVREFAPASRANCTPPSCLPAPTTTPDRVVPGWSHSMKQSSQFDRARLMESASGDAALVCWKCIPSCRLPICVLFWY